MSRQESFSAMPAEAQRLAHNHFALLGLPQQFAIQPSQLEASWRALQAKVHPDRYATASAAEKRIAMQWASQVNEAYRILRSPLRRARYLCELAGHSVQAESNTAMAPAFLMQQMAWREALEALQSNPDESALAALEHELAAARDDIAQSVAHALDTAEPQYPAAVTRVREWMFIERLFEELDAARP